MTSQPTELRPATVACANMGPDVRASRPMTILTGRRADGPTGVPSFAQVPNAAAQRATISGVRSVPTRPRTPDTLTIRVSDMDDQSNGKGVEERRQAKTWIKTVATLAGGFARRFSRPSGFHSTSRESKRLELRR